MLTLFSFPLLTCLLWLLSAKKAPFRAFMCQTILNEKENFTRVCRQQVLAENAKKKGAEKVE